MWKNILVTGAKLTKKRFHCIVYCKFFLDLNIEFQCARRVLTDECHDFVIAGSTGQKITLFGGWLCKKEASLL